MYIGKILRLFVLAACFFAAHSLCLPGASFAADVWCYSRDGRSFYMDSESINAERLPKGMDYRALVKTVLDSDGSLEKNTVYGFESQNDILVATIYDPSAKSWKFPEYRKEKPVLKAIWDSMKPYMKQKHISYSDSWKWE